MERWTLMGLLNDVEAAARQCETAAEAVRHAAGERHDLACDRRTPGDSCAAWVYSLRAEGGVHARHQADVHATLDLLRTSIDRLQGLVAELPRLDLPPPPDRSNTRG